MGTIIVPNYSNKYSKGDGTSYTRIYDGTVRIAPGEFFQTITTGGTTIINRIRSKIVFHELSENFYRVMGSNYEDSHMAAIADYSSAGILRANGTNSDSDQFESGAQRSHQGETYSFRRQ